MEQNAYDEHGNLLCPLCGAPMRGVMDKETKQVAFFGCTRFRSGGCNCRVYPDPEADGRPFLHVCTECGLPLQKRRSKGGNLFCACFNKEGHRSQDVIWYELDGTPREPLPEPKGRFSCPECKHELRYFRAKSGDLLWMCANEEGHASGRALFFGDNAGAPLL